MNCSVGQKNYESKTNCKPLSHAEQVGGFKIRGTVNKLVRDIGFFRSRSRRWPAAGREEQILKTQLIVFCQPYKTPNGSKNKKENKRVGAKNTELFGALA